MTRRHDTLLLSRCVQPRRWVKEWSKPMKLCIGADKSEVSRLAFEKLRQHPSLTVDGISQSGAELISVIRDTRIDAVLVPPDWIEVGRLIKMHVLRAHSTAPAFVISSLDNRISLRARAISVGLDGLLDLSLSTDEAVDQLNRIINQSSQGQIDSDIDRLGVVPGLLSRDLVLDSDFDRALADLIVAGLPDEAIAQGLNSTIQEVRNRIAAILSANEMQYRTQLAVAYSSSFQLPDFARLLAE